MKKKLLLFVAIISSLMCLLAISSSAATRKDLSGVDREITIYDDAPAKTNIKTSIDDVVIFDDGFCCPSAYIFKDSKTTPNGQWSMSFIEATDFGFLEKKGKNYTFANVVELDVPDGITYLGSYSAYTNTTLKKITIPYSVSSIGACLFERASALQYCIFENGGNPNIKTLPTYTFGSCSSLQSFSMPDSITKIAGESCFSGCKQLKALHLSNSLETIEGGGQQKATFDNCNNMYFINEFFDGNTIPAKPEVYYFPESLTTMSNTCIFRWCHNLNNVLVFGKNITEVPNLYTFENNSANTIVFLGNMTNVDISKWGTTTVYFANPNDKSLSDIETFNNSTDKPKTVYFCNADGNTNHLVSDKKDLVSEATCVDYAVYATKCYCGKTLGNVNGTELNPNNHDLENATLVSIVYAKYTDKGVKKVACGYSCGENIELDVDAIFKTLGYSIKNDGRGITTDYELNTKALEEYRAYLKESGKTFEFGVFLGNSNYFGETFVKANGSIDNEYGFSSKVSANDYSKIKCTVADFTTDEKDLTLVMGLYVIDDGKVSYVQHEGDYGATEKRGETALDVVTISKIATLTGVDLVLPEPKALPVENKEN